MTTLKLEILKYLASHNDDSFHDVAHIVRKSEIKDSPSKIKQLIAQLDSENRILLESRVENRQMASYNNPDYTIFCKITESANQELQQNSQKEGQSEVSRKTLNWTKKGVVFGTIIGLLSILLAYLIGVGIVGPKHDKNTEKEQPQKIDTAKTFSPPLKDTVIINTTTTTNSTITSIGVKDTIFVNPANYLNRNDTGSKLTHQKSNEEQKDIVYNQEKPVVITKKSKCEEENTGSYCFQNDTEFNLSILFVGQRNSLTCTIQPGQKKCFFEVVAGVARYEIKTPVTIDGYNSKSPLKSYYDDGSLFVEPCKEKLFIIK